MNEILRLNQYLQDTSPLPDVEIGARRKPGTGYAGSHSKL